MVGRPGVSLLLASFLACGSPPSHLEGSEGGTPDAPRADEPLADAAPPDAGLPDLALNLARARVDLALREALFQLDSCELDPDESCVAEPGTRRLLHFSIETPNIGDGDMVLGPPDPANPNFRFSECHGHYHFEGYAEYRLASAEGGDVVVGRKQAFCLLDSERYDTADPTVSRRAMFDCQDQGIQRGWSDVYHAGLPCQFIDVTGVPDGDYTLEIRLNANRTLVEKDYDNNAVSIPVNLGDRDIAGPTEPCPEGVDDHSSEGSHRECGWGLAGTFACKAGTAASVGCSAATACGGQACAGDPVMRVCDAARDDGNCSFPAAIRSSDNSSGTLCPCSLSVPCPASGQIAVYTAPSRVGQSFDCAVQVLPAP